MDEMCQTRRRNGSKSARENEKMKPAADIFTIFVDFLAAVCGLLIADGIQHHQLLWCDLNAAGSLLLALFLSLSRLDPLSWPPSSSSPPPSLRADGGKEERKEELITSLIEKGELCQNVAKEGGREIIFNIFNGSRIIRGGEAGEEGGGRWWRRGRLTLTQISSVSVHERCVFTGQTDWIHSS